MTNLTPLTPADCDLRDFPSMLLDVQVLRDSGLAAEESGDAFRAAVLLWCASWHQLPAASLPDDDRKIAHLAGYSRAMKEWAKIRAGALRGFVAGGDGLIYHPVIAEKALGAWIDKLRQRKASAAGNAKRYGHDFDPADFDSAIASAGDMLRRLNPRAKALSRSAGKALPTGSHRESDGTADPLPTGSQGKGKGEGKRLLDDDVDSARDGFPKKEDPPAADIWASGLTEVADELCRIGGVPNVNPAAINRNLEVARRWLADGIDPEADIVPAIRQCVVDAKDRISSLNYFDGAVRQRKAQAEARAAGHGPKAEPSEPWDANRVAASKDRTADLYEKMGRTADAAELRAEAGRIRCGTQAEPAATPA